MGESSVSALAARGRSDDNGIGVCTDEWGRHAMTRDLDWTHVRAFALVAKHGSLSKAARAGGLSQPTLGRQINALERSLGVTLFDRRATGLVPTPTGEALLEHAEAMGAAAHRLELAATGRSAAIAGTVRITASEVVATWVLPPILAALRHEEPDIDIELVAANESGNLLRREADIAVRMYRPVQSDVIARHVADAPIAGYASIDYVARRGNPVEIDDVPGHELVGYDTDDQIVRGFRGEGLDVTRESFSLRSDDQVVCWQMVLAGWGVGFINRSIGDAEPRVVAVFDGRTVDVLPVWLVAHAELRTSARIRRVYDALAEGLGGAPRLSDG